MNFRTSVLSAYQLAEKQKQWVKRIGSKFILAAGNPSEDYPPANVAEWIKQCESKGRNDLAKKIKFQWHNVLNKYPATRLSWGASVKIGSASIKKNVFEGKEFVQWFQENTNVPLSKAEKTNLVHLSEVAIPEGTPKIAIPKDGETAEAWQIAAQQTEEMLSKIDKAFNNANDLVAFLEKEISDIEVKIQNYDVGGKKHLTKTGEPHKFAARVPKWKEILHVYKQKLDDVQKKVKSAERAFGHAKETYHHAPVTTVAFEAQTKEHLAKVLEFIMELPDAKQQQEMLKKFNDMMEKQKATASAKVEVTALSLDGILNSFKNFFTKIINWAKGLMESVKTFDDFVSLRNLK